jgi:hypothetical protein
MTKSHQMINQAKIKLSWQETIWKFGFLVPCVNGQAIENANCNQQNFEDVEEVLAETKF